MEAQNKIYDKIKLCKHHFHKEKPINQIIINPEKGELCWITRKC